MPLAIASRLHLAVIVHVVARRAVFSHTGRAMRDDGEESDESLMIAYREGDGDAFERLYRRHRGGLFRYLRRQCASAAVAEELFQDVWTNLIRSRERYVPEARFAAYLYRVAHNHLVDHYRRSAHRPSIASDDDPEADPVSLLAVPASEEPSARYESKQRVERFARLLDELPQPQREAFVMHEEGGLSVEEIATATGVNPETAKSRLRYAVAKLRRGLEAWV